MGSDLQYIDPLQCVTPLRPAEPLLIGPTQRNAKDEQFTLQSRVYVMKDGKIVEVGVGGGGIQRNIKEGQAAADL